MGWRHFKSCFAVKIFGGYTYHSPLKNCGLFFFFLNLESCNWSCWYFNNHLYRTTSLPVNECSHTLNVFAVVRLRAVVLLLLWAWLGQGVASRNIQFKRGTCIVVLKELASSFFFSEVIWQVRSHVTCWSRMTVRPKKKTWSVTVCS